MKEINDSWKNIFILRSMKVYVKEVE